MILLALVFIGGPILLGLLAAAVAKRKIGG
jgi:hypothetical protein